MIFSKIFNVEKDIVKQYGAVDISLLSDTPLFIDPMLIMYNDDEEIRNQYQNLVKYLLFLKNKAKSDLCNDEINYYFSFKEIKNNWLGMSLSGNQGLALGIQFASELYKYIQEVCETHSITNQIHVEKMFLLNKGVGRDKISDWTTNILLEFFVDYTEKFARQYLDETKCSVFSIDKCCFDYDNEIFKPKKAYLPFVINKRGKKEFVLLTPVSILRKDEQAINYVSMNESMQDIINNCISNDELRFQVNKIITNTIKELYDFKFDYLNPVPTREINDARKHGIELAIAKYPELIDYFIRSEEDDPTSIKSLAQKETLYVTSGTIDNVIALSNVFGIKEDVAVDDSFKESLARVNFLKNEIEVNGLYKNLYFNEEEHYDEKLLQRLFKLSWFNSLSRITAEANNGVGPIDFLVTKGRFDSCLIEFKLAKNSKLSHVYLQVDKYRESHRDISKAIIVIFAFSDKDLEKAAKVKNSNPNENNYVIIVDCDRNNKKSASQE